MPEGRCATAGHSVSTGRAKVSVGGDALHVVKQAAACGVPTPDKEVALRELSALAAARGTISGDETRALRAWIWRSMRSGRGPAR